MAEYDVIVVGAGGTMGSNAMLQLAKAGAKARDGVASECRTDWGLLAVTSSLGCRDWFTR